MSQNQIIAKLEEIQALRQMQEELAAEIESIQDEVKAHMTEAYADTLSAGQYKVTWKPVASTRIDTAALRKDLPEAWQEYGKTTTCRRFIVALAK